MDDPIQMCPPGVASSAADILAVPDIAEAWVEVEPWIINGKPAILHLRGMGCRDELDAHLASIGPDGKKSETAYLVEVFRRTILAPTFTPDQLIALSNKSPHVIKMLLAFVLRLGYMPPELVHRYVVSLTGKQATADGGTAKPRSARKRTRSGN